MDEADPLSVPWSEDQVAMMRGMRDWAVTFDELHRHLSTWMDLPGSDANALGQIVWAAQSGQPLSPVQLSRQIGMTSGATSVLLDRLEDAGYLTRHRESADRRRVSLRPTERAREETRGFLAFAGAEIATTVSETDPGDVGVVLAFLSRMTAAAAAANTRLASLSRPAPPAPAGSPRPGSATRPAPPASRGSSGRSRG